LHNKISYHIQVHNKIQKTAQPLNYFNKNLPGYSYTNQDGIYSVYKIQSTWLRTSFQAALARADKSGTKLEPDRKLHDPDSPDQRSQGQ